MQAQVESAASTAKKEAAKTEKAKEDFQHRIEVIQRRRTSFDMLFRDTFILPMMTELQSQAPSL